MRDVPVRWRWDLVLSVVIATTFVYAVYEARDWAEEASLFPLAVALPGVALAIAQIVISIRSRGAAAEAVPADEEGTLPAGERSKRTAEIAGWILAFFAAVWLIGFQIAVPLGAVAYLRIAAREGWLPSAVVAAGCWALVVGVFDRVLHVPMPAGELLRILGVS